MPFMYNMSFLPKWIISRLHEFEFVKDLDKSSKHQQNKEKIFLEKTRETLKRQKQKKIKCSFRINPNKLFKAKNKLNLEIVAHKSSEKKLPNIKSYPKNLRMNSKSPTESVKSTGVYLQVVNRTKNIRRWSEVPQKTVDRKDNEFGIQCDMPDDMNDSYHFPVFTPSNQFYACDTFKLPRII